MLLKKISLAALVLGGGVLMTACGGGDGDGADYPTRVTGSTSAEINGTTGPTVMAGVLPTANSSATFTFDKVADLGTTSTTTVKLSGSAAAPDFTISSAEGSVDGTMTYGSCFFNFKPGTSKYVAPHKLAGNPAPIPVPCSFFIDTKNQVPGTFNLGVILSLGNIMSKPLSLPVTITQTGSVLVNGKSFGQTTVVTGAGS